MSSSRDLEFLYEIGCIRFIRRSWHRFLGPNFQNLAEHHFRVIWISLVLARMEKVSNLEKIIKMALVHDIQESRTGDVDYLQRQYVKRSEDIGIQDMLHDTSLSDDFLSLWHEYESKSSLEAKIVKDADNLDVDLELVEQSASGNVLKQLWYPNRKHVSTLLYTKSAKKLWRQIYSSNPHDWHLNGRNRINMGDWKKPSK